MTEYRVSSPVSDMFGEEADSMSIQDRVLLKRSLSRHDNNNLKAGYVPVNEQHMSKTGLRGRKTFAFWTLICLLFILAVGNLILTVTILGVLRMGRGMESLEVVPVDSSIKFYGETDLDHLYKKDGRIEGYADEPIQIISSDGTILLNLSTKSARPQTKLKINKNGTTLYGFDLFEIKNRDDEVIYNSREPYFPALKGVYSLDSKLVETNRVISMVDKPLVVESKIINIKGAEGTTVDGKKISWAADQDIYLKSVNGSVILSAKEGVFIADVKKIEVAGPKRNIKVMGQYKVCVCMPQGKLFKIPVPNVPNPRVYCHHINMSPEHNPCI